MAGIGGVVFVKTTFWIKNFGVLAFCAVMLEVESEHKAWLKMTGEEDPVWMVACANFGVKPSLGFYKIGHHGSAVLRFGDSLNESRCFMASSLERLCQLVGSWAVRKKGYWCACCSVNMVKSCVGTPV